MQIYVKLVRFGHTKTKYYKLKENAYKLYIFQLYTLVMVITSSAEFSKNGITSWPLMES